MLLLAACSHREAPRDISRLDLIAPGDSLTAALQREFDAWSEVIAFDGTADEYAGGRAVQAFSPMVKERIESLDSVEAVLGHALKDYGSARLVGVISPYNQAVVTHPSGYVFIALNHYLGADSPAYAGFPDYMKKRKELKQLPSDVVEAVIAAKYVPEFADDATLLNHMLYRGTLLNAVAKALPEDTPEATILGMTPEEYEWCVENEGRIWQTLIERQMLFSADAGMIDRLMKPSPRSTLINANAPGQTILFTALKIAQAYEKATGTAAAPEAAFYNDNQTLVKSQYAPANANR